MTTYFRLTRFPDALHARHRWASGITSSLRSANSIQRSQDPLAALAADLGSSGEALTHASSFQGGKEMWCTPSLLTAAGRRCYRVGNRFVAAMAPPAGGEEVTVYDFMPMRLQVDDQGKLTTIDLKAAESNLHVIHARRPRPVRSGHERLPVRPVRPLPARKNSMSRGQTGERYECLGILVSLRAGRPGPPSGLSSEAVPLLERSLRILNRAPSGRGAAPYVLYTGTAASIRIPCVSRPFPCTTCYEMLRLEDFLQSAKPRFSS